MIILLKFSWFSYEMVRSYHCYFILLSTHSYYVQVVLDLSRSFSTYGSPHGCLLRERLSLCVEARTLGGELMTKVTSTPSWSLKLMRDVLVCLQI